MPQLPDLVGAFITRTKQFSDDPNGWDRPTTAIVYNRVPGPMRGQPGTTPVRSEPIQFEVYAKNQLSAVDLWEKLEGNFFPETPSPQGFIAGHCAVISIESMGSAAPIQENPTDWPRVVGTWLVTYMTRRV
jgi:hypothetical protein